MGVAIFGGSAERASSRPSDATTLASAGADWSGPVDDPRVAVVVLAGGSGVRVGASRNKVYLPLAGCTVVARSLSTLSRLSGLRRLVLVIRPEDEDLALRVLRSELRHSNVPVELVTGGATRHGSEERALVHLAPAIYRNELDVVLIHDAARPLASRRLAESIVRAAAQHGGAVPGLQDDLVRMVGDGNARSLASDFVHVRIQTPQAFAAAPLLAAYLASGEAGFTGTDTESCVSRFTTLRVKCVPGEPQNLKITHPTDMYLAEQLLLHHEESLSFGS
jgi:2-C-methyl-D-erythritol 4-phosphate cytidylyltransferase